MHDQRFLLKRICTLSSKVCSPASCKSYISIFFRRKGDSEKQGRLGLSFLTESPSLMQYDAVIRASSRREKVFWHHGGSWRRKSLVADELWLPATAGGTKAGISVGPVGAVARQVTAVVISE